MHDEDDEIFEGITDPLSDEPVDPCFVEPNTDDSEFLENDPTVRYSPNIPFGTHCVIDSGDNPPGYVMKRVDRTK